jgi:hydroxypyruvate reductase/glycerate 2-kinase
LENKQLLGWDMLFNNREKIIENGKTPKLKEVRRDILDILTSAIKAVDPYNAVKSRFDGKKILLDSKIIDTSDFKEIFLIGFGKASFGMAKAVCDSVKIKAGAIISNTSHQSIEKYCVKTLIGGHPIPNENSIDSTEKILKIVKKCGKDDLLIVLISGGGSALLCKPRVNLQDLQITTDLLLKSGANINEINTIRKHLSYVKGGQLAALANCNIVSFIISDIIRDPIEFIASGPTYPDSTTFNDTKIILKKYDLWMNVPPSIRKEIENGITGKTPETPKKDASIFSNVNNMIVANNEIACETAEKKAKELGYHTMLLTTQLEGEAKEVGKYLVEKAINYSTDVEKMVFITGGETTVTIKGKGKGGRNQEMVLSCIKDLSDNDVIFSSFATDGIDGVSDAAGAIADRFSLSKAKELKLSPDEYMNDNNSYEFFKLLDDLIITGPTGTNVMDLQILIKIKNNYIK